MNPNRFSHSSGRLSPKAVLTFVLGGLAFSLSTPTIAETTDPVGYTLMSIAGNGGSDSRLSLIAPTFMNEVEYQGSLDTISATNLTVNGTPWSADQFNDPTLSHPTHFVEIIDGSGAGVWTHILDTTSNSLILDDTLQNLSEFTSDGASFRIRRHITLADFFGPNNEAGLKPGLSAGEADQVSILNAQSGSQFIYFFADVPELEIQGWFDTFFQPADDAVISPHQGVIVRRKESEAVDFLFVGSAKTGDSLLPVATGLNVVGIIDATGSLTLGNSGLSGGVVGGPSAGEADQIHILQESGSSSIYFFADIPELEIQGWFDTLFQSADNVALNSGTAIVIVRQGAEFGFNWLVPATLENSFLPNS